jgi:hypothetical protein
VTLDGVAVIVALSFAAQLAGLVYIARLTRECIRIGRAVAALVYQEEEKTRALIRDARGPRGAS